MNTVNLAYAGVHTTFCFSQFTKNYYLTLLISLSDVDSGYPLVRT